eukprot:1132853-Amphidinium_carterae.2
MTGRRKHSTRSQAGLCYAYNEFGSDRLCWGGIVVARTRLVPSSAALIGLMVNNCSLRTQELRSHTRQVIGGVVVLRRMKVESGRCGVGRTPDNRRLNHANGEHQRRITGPGQACENL